MKNEQEAPVVPSCDSFDQTGKTRFVYLSLLLEFVQLLALIVNRHKDLLARGNHPTTVC